MSSEVLEKVKQLPPEKQQEVEDFINYLLQKYKINNEAENIAEKRRNNMGWAKGKIWMADDFNDTPEDFKDYL
jgi:mRNA-degrading endonuclease RelE of RelBE toxin-antitoxin system